MRIKISILLTLAIPLDLVMHIASAACMRSVILCVCVCVNGASLLGKDHSSMWVSASAVSQLQDLTKAVY